MQRMGFIHGTGADLEIELGWVPDWVRVVNLTDGDIIYENFLGKVIAFTSGGTTEIKKGHKIRGLTTTSAIGTIREVMLDSGSWAGGDAAGWFIFDAADISGTFGSETAECDFGTGSYDGVDSVTVAVQDEDGIDIDTEVAGTTTDDTTITSYTGDATNGYAMGFKIGATVSENGKLLGFVAMKNGPGESQEVKVAGNTQAAAVW